MAAVNPFALIEAVNSVALEHPETCQCLACRAAAGDRDALAEVCLLLAEAGV